MKIELNKKTLFIKLEKEDAYLHVENNHPTIEINIERPKDN